MAETNPTAEAEAEEQEATAEESQEEPVAEAKEVEKPEAKKSDELKVVIILHGKKIMIGVQATDCDPVYTTLEGTLPTALQQVPKLVKEAKLKWDAHPRYPNADLPTPEPTPAPARSSRAPAAPEKKKEQPSFF